MTDAIETALSELRRLGCDPRPARDGWLARCPAHEDRDPSLSVRRGDDGRLLLYCHAGCPFSAIVASLGMKPRDTFTEDHRPRPPEPREEPKPRHNWPRVASEFAAQITARQLAALAEQLFGATAPEWIDALRALGIGWAERRQLGVFTRGGRARAGGYTIPMVNKRPRICGVQVRCANGQKWTLGGSKLGLFIPRGVRERPGELLSPEGASDTAAAWACGLAAVGRPMAALGAEYLAALFGDRSLVIVAENDRKPDGSWPGRTGAHTVADKVERIIGRRPRVLLPPEHCKDMRDVLRQHAPPQPTP